MRERRGRAERKEETGVTGEQKVQMHREKTADILSQTGAKHPEV